MIAPPQHCDECGFEASSVGPEEAANAIRSIGPAFRDALAPVDDQAVRRRPDASTWSALEYAAHMRDVIALWGGALHKAVTEEGPALPVPDPDIADRTAAESSYNDQEPAAVIAQLVANADRMANKATKIEGDGWARVIVIGPEELSALDIVHKVAHEGRHHRQDVTRVLP